MPKVATANVPVKLRPYVNHHVKFAQSEFNPKGEAQADCPFCDVPLKFFVNAETGLWQCKICGGPSKKGGGNVYNFLRELHKASVAKMRGVMISAPQVC